MPTVKEIIKNNYNNNVTQTVQGINSAIMQQGMSDVVQGSDLAQRLCKNLELNQQSKICGQGNTSILNGIINSLPLYFVIAHSSVDIPLVKGSGSKTLRLDSANPMFKKIKVASSLNQSKFLINTTTAGAWGILDKAVCDIPPDHLLREDGRIVRDYMFNPEIPCQARIGRYVMQETKQGNTPAIPTTRYPADFNLPGSNYVNKIHQFGGDRLSGGGFGIVKVISSGSADFALSTWQARSKRVDDDNFDKNVYFLTSSGGDIGRGYMTNITDKDLALWNLIKDRWDKNTQMSNVNISEIIETGGPGIYISLSCSEYFFYIDGMPYTPNNTASSPDIQLAYSVSMALNEIGSYNRLQWDNFTKVLQMVIQKTRNSAYAPNAVVCDESHGRGIKHYLTSGECPQNPKTKKRKGEEGGGKKRGKRRRTKRRKKRTRKRRRKKTMKRKKRKRR